MILRALILGKGAPNRCRDGTATLCAIALTRELGLIRIYPLHVEQRGVRVWSVCDLSLEPSRSDSRRESWKVLAAQPVGFVDDRADRAAILHACLLPEDVGDPIAHQNTARASVAVVPALVTAQIVERGACNEVPDAGETGDSWVMCQRESAHKPLIRWRAPNGSGHESHVVSQEVYEFIRQNPTDPARVFSNLQLTNPDYGHWLVIGNMRDRRNVWVVVHVHRMKLPVVPSSGHWFASAPLGNPGWPYWSQQAAAVRRAEEPQMALPFDLDLKKAS